MSNSRVRGRLVSGVLVRVKTPMMKVEVEERGDRVIIQVEGRLAGIFVPELENCWNAARARHRAREIAVDLKNVTCVDRAGRSLLQRMHGHGVEFLRAGLATQDILDQITGDPHTA